MERIADYFGFQTRASEPGGSTAPSAPPRPPATTHVSPDAAVTISDVYRGIQIIGTAVSQLTLDQYRGATPLAEPHALASRPDIDLDTAHFLEENATSLATCGNAYWRHRYSPLRGELIGVRLLNPAEVLVEQDYDTDEVRYYWRGKQIPRREISHLKMLRRTGYPLGLGPIQAAQIELAGTIDARNYSAKWMSETDIPTGVLSTDQTLTGEQAKTYKQLWRGDGTTAGGHEIRVVGSGLRYEPILLKPADMQFLETRQFNKAQLATLFGIPATLLNAPVERGSSRTYQNVEQEWIAFNRFTLMAYLRPIEIALSTLLPRNNTVRFNVDALLRTDTKTRYEAHEIGIRAQFLTVPEVRAMEGLPPIPTRQEATRVAA